MSWIQTLDSKKFDLWNPSPETIDPETLSTVLGRICRFGGHCLNFYSVAQHSLLVESLVDDPELKLPALLHDAHEAYWGFGDVCRPAKNLSPYISGDLASLARRVDKAVAERFGFNAELFNAPAIKHADNVLLATEARDVMGPPPEPWLPLPDPLLNKISVFMSPQVAAVYFRSRLKELTSNN